MEHSDAKDTRNVVFVQGNGAARDAAGAQTAAKAHTARVNWQRLRQQRLRLQNRSVKAKTTAESTTTGSEDDPSVLLNEIVDNLDLTQLRHELPSPTRSAAFAALLHKAEPLQRQVTRQVAEHLVHVCWPEMLYSDSAISAWFQSFCEHPIIFHGFHCAASIHADVLDGRISRSASREVIVHKSIVFRLLNDMLSELSETNTKIDINIAIQSVLLLTHDEFGASSLDVGHALPFSPHFPAAGWPGIFGNIDAAEPHSRAIEMLVERAGGLNALTFPGLGSTLALCDLIASSVEIRVPHYPCFWDETSSASISKGLMRPSWKEGPAHGFSMHPFQPLPQGVLLVVQELATVDAAMADCRYRRLHSSDYRKLIHWRNAAHHRLLSLPPQPTSLSVSSDVPHSLLLAELCRITALLYSNSVIFPLPPRRPWRMKLLASLAPLLHALYAPNLEGESWRILTWSACVGALVANGSVFQDSIVTSLRRNLGFSQIKTLNDLQAVLVEFLWSPLACDYGLSMLWGRLLLTL